MTREKCKDLLPLFIAFANGAHVEYLNHQGEWVTEDNIGFGTTGVDRYRVNGKQYSEGDTSVAIDVIISQIKSGVNGSKIDTLLAQAKKKLNSRK